MNSLRMNKIWRENDKITDAYINKYIEISIQPHHYCLKEHSSDTFKHEINGYSFLTEP